MKLFFIFFTILVLNANSSLAQNPSKPFTETNNHDGFFLRTFLGFEQTNYTQKEFGYYVTADWDIKSYDLKISGLGMEFRVQIGSSILDNLILHGDVGGIFVLKPSLEPSVNLQSLSFKSKNSSLIISDLGGGVTYYFMPQNIYLSVSVMFSASFIKYEMPYNYGVKKIENTLGPGLFLSVGKEWWVSESWGIGVSLLGSYRSMKHKENESKYGQDISTYSFGVAFSSTLN